MRAEKRIDPSTVPGWGVDADPDNDPTYPIRDRSKDDHSGDWARPALQQTDIEVLQSIEYIRRPAVFGTSTPPRGLSGIIRRRAFAYSESHWFHWLMLMGADRVDMVEGILDDLAHGKVPNIPGEMGARAEWKHNKAGFVMKLAATAAIAAAVTTLVAGSRKRAASLQPRGDRQTRQRLQPMPPRSGLQPEMRAT
jgi:hypothetical protein